ncbi:MAG: hypothetical protein ACKPKO_27305, partial [Candidatus Fonsibacter sp.]
MEVLKSFDKLAAIMSAGPLNIVAVDGFKHLFKQQEMEIAFQMQGRYGVGGSAFWLNMLYTPNPHVPIHPQAADALVYHHYKAPSPLDGITVSMMQGHILKVVDYKGALEACSPEAFRHAYLFAIARDIEAEEWEAVDKWVQPTLSTTFTFVLHADVEERYWAALQMRDNIAQNSQAMSRTVIQRIYDIGRFRDVQRENM